MTPKCSTFLKQKTLEKCDTLGTFTQTVLFLDYNKTNKQKEKGGTILGSCISKFVKEKNYEKNLPLRVVLYFFSNSQNIIRIR